jgi:hypothetical protein
MAPEWRIVKKDEFLKLPNSHEKLSTLFGAPGMALEDAQNRFNLKLNKHRVAIVVPEGCHVEGENTEISFGREIYTFFVSPEIKLHTRRK